MVTDCHHFRFVLHVSSYAPAQGTDVMNSQTPSDALVQPPKGSHDFTHLLILRTVGLTLRNVTKSATNRNKFVKYSVLPDHAWWFEVMRDTTSSKVLQPICSHRKQHILFASSRVQATKIMNGFLSAEVSMNFTSGVEMTPGQSIVLVLCDFSRQVCCTCRSVQEM